MQRISKGQGYQGYCEKDDRPVNQSRDLNLSRKKKRSAQHDWFAKGEAMYDSVLFVPATHKSHFINIRDIEAANCQGRKTRIKIVELTGRTVRNTIAKNYPWRFEGCGSEPDTRKMYGSVPQNTECHLTVGGQLYTMRHSRTSWN